MHQGNLADYKMIGGIAKLKDALQLAFKLNLRVCKTRRLDMDRRQRRQPQPIDFADISRLIGAALLNNIFLPLGDHVDHELAAGTDIQQRILQRARPRADGNRE
jgi:hypothetical protein